MNRYRLRRYFRQVDQRDVRALGCQIVDGRNDQWSRCRSCVEEEVRQLRALFRMVRKELIERMLALLLARPKVSPQECRACRCAIPRRVHLLAL